MAQIVEVKGHIQSMFLYVSATELLLLDSGCSCDVASLLSFLAKNWPKRELTGVLVSHMHPDHAGGAHLWDRRYRRPIYCHRKALDWYSGVKGFFLQQRDTWLAGYVARRMGKNKENLSYPRSLDPVTTLEDGEQIPGHSSWFAIHTPGHTDHDLCFWHKALKSLYVGDLFVVINGQWRPPIPVTDREAYLSSLEKVRSLNPKECLLAHGGQVAFQEDLFEQLVRTARKPQKLTNIFATAAIKAIRGRTR